MIGVPRQRRTGLAWVAETNKNRGLSPIWRVYWNDPHLVRGVMHISLFWGVMMTTSAVIAVVEKMLGTASSFNFTLSLMMIGVGAGCTTLFKRKKRIEREQLAAADLPSAGLADQRES